MSRSTGAIAATMFANQPSPLVSRQKPEEVARLRVVVVILAVVPSLGDPREPSPYEATFSDVPLTGPPRLFGP